MHTINFALIGLLLLAIAVILGLLRSRGDAAPSGRWPYFAKKALSRPEQVLYFRLVRALPDNIVLPQVQLSRILGVKRGSDYQSWLNRISQMSVDFLVCAKDATVLAVVELDDESHSNNRRAAADGKKDRALAAAGIKIVRWETSALPDEAAIRSSLLPSTPGMGSPARTSIGTGHPDIA